MRKLKIKNKWKCSHCEHICFEFDLKIKDFGQSGKGNVCPKCESENVFPYIKKEWEKAAEINSRYLKDLDDKR